MVPSFLSPTKNKNFRNLWLAQITSQIALNMLIFVLGILVYQETKSNAAVSFLLLTFNIPAIIFGVIAGGIVDHFDKRKVLMFCNFSRLVIMIIFFIYFKNIVVLLILSVVMSIITQLFIPAEGPAIVELVDKKELLSANSLFTVSYYLSTIIGFVIAGPAVKFLAFRFTYLFMGILLGLASFLVLKLPKMVPVHKYGDFSFSFTFIGKAIDEGIQFIKSNERVKRSLALMTFAQALIITLTVLAPGFADKILSIDLTDASYLVMGPAAIGLVIGSLLIGNYGYKFLKGSIILAGIIFTGINLLLLSFITRSTAQSIFMIDNIYLAMILLFLIGIFNSFITVPANTILQSDSNSQMRGRVYGVLTSLTGGISFIPVIFSGIFADFLGISLTLFVIGIIVTVIGTFQYIKRFQGKINIV
jgi:MFS family permease